MVCWKWEDAISHSIFRTVPIGMRTVTCCFWVGICFLIAPSKVAAIAYALLLGGIVIVTFAGVGIMVGIRRLFRRML